MTNRNFDTNFLKLSDLSISCKLKLYFKNPTYFYNIYVYLKCTLPCIYMYIKRVSASVIQAAWLSLRELVQTEQTRSILIRLCVKSRKLATSACGICKRLVDACRALLSMKMHHHVF